MRCILRGAAGARPRGDVAVRAHPRGGEHCTDARASVGKRDEPEPTALVALAEDDDLDVALPLALVAPCAAHLREEGRAVEVCDALRRSHGPGDGGLTPARVDDESRRDYMGRSVLRPSLHARRAVPVEDHPSRLPSLAQVRAARPGAPEQELVEFVARDLKRVVPARVECLGERVSHRASVVRAGHETRPVLREKPGSHLVQRTHRFEHPEAGRQQRFAEVEARMTFPLEHDHATPSPRQARGADRACRTAADHRDVEPVSHSAGFGGGPSWMRSPMYAPMRVKRMPIAAKMR